MKLKKILAIGIVLLFALSMFAGCSDNGDAIVAKVGETPIYRWSFDAYLVRQLSMYEKYTGTDLTRSENKEEFEQYKEFRLEELIGEAAIREEARNLGLDQLTAEEEATIDQTYLDYRNRTMAGYLEQYGSDEAGQKKAEEAYNKLLSNSNLTPERMRESIRDAFVVNKVLEHLTDGLQITEEEIRASYDNTLEKYQSESIANPLWFGENAIDPIVYAPEGYIDTARITLRFTDKQMAKLSAAAIAANQAQEEYAAAAQIHGENSSQAQKLISEMNKTEEEFQTIQEECYQELTASMEEIRQEVLNGADFIKTLEAKSQDSNLINYLITKGSTHVEQNYVDAALKLQNEGDISEVVRLEQGVCIIRLMEVVAPGARAYEEVKDGLRDNLIANLRVNLNLNMQQTYAQKAYDDDIVTIYKQNLK